MIDQRNPRISPELLRDAATLTGTTIAELALPQDHHTVVNGYRYHRLDWGGSGEPVLLLHGGSLTAHTYDLVSDSVSLVRHRL